MLRSWNMFVTCVNAIRQKQCMSNTYVISFFCLLPSLLFYTLHAWIAVVKSKLFFFGTYALMISSNLPSLHDRLVCYVKTWLKIMIPNFHTLCGYNRIWSRQYQSCLCWNSIWQRKLNQFIEKPFLNFTSFHKMNKKSI